MAEQSKEKQANEQAKAQNLLLVGEKKKHYIAKTKRKIKMIAKMKLNKFKVIYFIKLLTIRLVVFYVFRHNVLKSLTLLIIKFTF